MAHERYPLRKSRTCAIQAAKSSVACSPLPDRWVRLGRPLRRKCSNSWRLNATSSISLRSCGVDTGVKLREGSYTPIREGNLGGISGKGKGVTLRAGSETLMGAAKSVQDLVEASSASSKKRPPCVLWTIQDYKNYCSHYLCSGHIMSIRIIAPHYLFSGHRKNITFIAPIFFALDI